MPFSKSQYQSGFITREFPEMVTVHGSPVNSKELLPHLGRNAVNLFLFMQANFPSNVRHRIAFSHKSLKILRKLLDGGVDGGILN